jgi:hypothetical protein
LKSESFPGVAGFPSLELFAVALPWWRNCVLDLINLILKLRAALSECKSSIVIIILKNQVTRGIMAIII